MRRTHATARVAAAWLALAAAGCGSDLVPSGSAPAPSSEDGNAAPAPAADLEPSAERAPAAAAGGCAPPPDEARFEGTAAVGGSVAFARHEGRALAFVADEDEGTVRVVDLDAGAEVGAVAVGPRPSALVLAPSGRLH